MSSAEFDTRIYDALSSSYGADRALLAHLRKERARVAEELDLKLEDDLAAIDTAIAYESEQCKACQMRIEDDMRKRCEAEKVYERESQRFAARSVRMLSTQFGNESVAVDHQGLQV